MTTNQFVREFKLLVKKAPELKILIMIRDGNQIRIETDMCLRCASDEIEEFVTEEGIEHVCEGSELVN